jgi:hypothetical protein
VPLAHLAAGERATEPWYPPVALRHVVDRVQDRLADHRLVARSSITRPRVSDKFRAQVEESLQRNGWGKTLWLETSVEDPGRAMTRQAVAEQVDLVVSAERSGTC